MDMDYSMMPDQTDAETARLGRQNAALGASQNPLQNQALMEALRKYGGRTGGPQGNGQMVGKFYVPQPVNPVTTALGAGSSIMGSFGGKPGMFGG